MHGKTEKKRKKEQVEVETNNKKNKLEKERERFVPQSPRLRGQDEVYASERE